MTLLVLAAALAVVAHLALQSAHLWWGLGSCRPLVLVVVLGARRLSPIGTAWLGLVLGLLTDVLTDRIIGPGGIAGAFAGVSVAVVVRRFELEGPLFWVGGALLTAACSELAWRFIIATFGSAPDHGWLGGLATIATTASAAMVVALVEWGWRSWRSPARIRRRALRRP